MKKMILLLAALMVLPVSAKPKKEMALQLYSIREVIGSPENYAKNHVEVFKKLHDWGYTAIEAASWSLRLCGRNGGHRWHNGHHGGRPPLC